MLPISSSMKGSRKCFRIIDHYTKSCSWRR